MRYSENLVEVRKDISEKTKELRNLNETQKELWKKLINEFNNNLAKYKKMEGLSGIVKANKYKEDMTSLEIVFEANNKPSATALSQIETDTGLSFMGIKESDVYVFGLH